MKFKPGDLCKVISNNGDVLLFKEKCGSGRNDYSRHSSNELGMILSSSPDSEVFVLFGTNMGWVWQGRLAKL